MTKNKWTVRLILLVTIILAGLIILFNIKVKENNIHISKLGLENNILESGNLDFDCANGFWIDDVQQNHGDNPPFTMPYINGRAIYCIQQLKDEGYDRVSLLPKSNNKFNLVDAYTPSQIIVTDLFDIPSPIAGKTYEINIGTNNAKKVKKYWNDHEGYGDAILRRSRGYFYCSENHISVLESSNDKGMGAAVAYLITANPCNKWTGIKQIVMWWLDSTYGQDEWDNFLNTLRPEKRTYARENKEEIIKLYKEAIYYKKFYDKVLEATDWENDSEYADNRTEEDSLTTSITTINNIEYIKSGPYQMDYVKGDYGTSVLDERMTFGGISDLYLETRSNTRIDIELIEVDGEIKQVNTFQPIEKPGDPESEDEYYVERGGGKLYPVSGQEFYILVPKQDLQEDGILKAKFEWMRADATKCTKIGFTYFMEKVNTKTGKLTVRLDEALIQDMAEYKGLRTLRSTSLDLGTVTPPPEEGSYVINIIKEDNNGNPLPGATFNVTINGELHENLVSDDNGVIYSNSPLVNNEEADIYEIEETGTPSGYIMLQRSIKFKVNKQYNNNTHTWEAIGVTLIDPTNLDENKAQIIWNNSTHTVTVIIKNLKPTTPPSPELDTYYIEAQKVDLDGNGLAGAEFNITWPNGDVSKAISDKKGNLVVQGDEPVLTITSEGLDHFKIEETSAPEDYSLISGPIEFDVKKEKADFTIGEEDVYIVTGIINVIAPDGVQIEWDAEANKVIIVIPNIKQYKINALKTDVEGGALTGAKFTVVKNNGKAEECISDSKGYFIRNELVEVNNNNKDNYKITEIEAPEGYRKIEGVIEFNVLKEKYTPIGIEPVSTNPYPEGVTVEWDTRTKTVIIIVKDEKAQLITIGGNVWEDAKTGKASLGDGINNTSNGVDKNLANIKVSLYTQNGTLATLTPPETVNNIYHKINPTLTDENGNYKFEGVDLSKDEKYYVVFEYDGQVYMPTEYLAKGISGDTIQNYNSVKEMLNDIEGSSVKGDNNTGKTQGKETNTWLDVWKLNSKASEFETNIGKVPIESRETFNSRFAEIGSSPKNYVTKNNLNIKLYLTYSDGKYYNKTYTRLELMGYTLKQVDGKPEYVQDKVQLVDGYKYNKYGTLNYDENGRITNEWAEGLISTKIKEFIKNSNKYPNSKELNNIYKQIAGTDKEMWKKLQFIEDCKISAITKSPFNNEGIEYYPTDKNDYFEGDLLTNYVNLGLWRRQEFNAQLIKDVTAIEYTINGKTETYKYDGKKTALENIKSCMDTYVTAKDDTNLAWIYSTSQENINKNRISNNYYNTKYNRAIYNSDYESKAGIGEELDIQIKYRITIINTSQSIETQIKEIVDYYDDSLTLREVKVNGTNITLIPRTSIYGAITETSFNGYNKIYINGDVLEKQISTGGEINIDLTYKINNMKINDLDDYLNIGDKINIAEINGYKTYYAANTSTPNRHGEIIGNNTTIAGLIDVNSTPGNLSTTETITNGVYNFEDDSDKIEATLEIKPNPDNPTEKAKRTINGYVWEDLKVSDGLGNGIRDDNETKIKGVDVALCEKINLATSSYESDEKLPLWISQYNQQLEGYKYIPARTYNGTSWTLAVTKTDENGYYEFKGFIPGDYYVIFGYGYSDETLLPKNSETTNIIGKSGENNKSYNGQDYKSTIFENGINTKNDSWRDDLGTYSYSLDATLISDAIDDLDRVDKVNSYSKEQTNHIAEVLVSPYNVPKYLGESYGTDDMNSLLNELKDRTWKVAKTRKIDAKVEYASNGTTDAIGKKEETKEWILPNIDLGLVERPKTQLEITKNVKNVKVTLSDGSIVFDATQTAEATKGNEIKDVIWKSNKFNTTKGITPTWGFIQLYLDEELMYGATIQIEYNMNITQPINEIDYTGDNYYVKGKKDGALVTTNATEVICYIPNKMQFDKTINEDKWSLIEDTQKEIFDNGLVNINLTDKVNSIDTKVKIEDGNVANISKNNLTVSQLITKESAQGGYVSVVEIVKIQNSVGRRMAEYIINPNDKEEKTIYPIVGNQNPTEAPAEIDSAKGEDVAVMPPFGARHVYYYVLGIVVAGVLVVGIVLIKKKVLKK